MTLGQVQLEACSNQGYRLVKGIKSGSRNKTVLIEMTPYMLELINNPCQTEVEKLTHFLQCLCVPASLFKSVVGRRLCPHKSFSNIFNNICSFQLLCCHGDIRIRSIVIDSVVYGSQQPPRLHSGVKLQLKWSVYCFGLH